jgi:wyosine [tRNA(Phe)-imidazoG37] synthetase (radical SAM superfamily)
MYHHLFGPVPSRRLGISLGVDLVPRKVCSLDCVYCEVGRTNRLTLDRREYVPLDRIKKELDHYFSHSPDPDYITFSGSGEPTLNTCIGDVLSFIKHRRPRIPVAVLTNGTLLNDPAVREALMNADVVLPSLDAATDAVFKKINRPHADLTLDAHLAGLMAFRNMFKGRFRLEVFILPGYNDHKDELNAMKKVIQALTPECIQLNTLDRPGTVTDLKSASPEELQRIAQYLDPGAAEIIASAPMRKHLSAYRQDMETAIMETIARRPCTLDDLSTILGLHVSEINKYLDVMTADNKIIAVHQNRGIFYQIAE